MSSPDSSLYSRRYAEALIPGVIRARAECHGVVADGLLECGVEEACYKLEIELKAVLLITDQLENIIKQEIGRALAHAKYVYKNSKEALRVAYTGVDLDAGIAPTFVTGLAGVGKTRLRLAIQRVLTGRQTISIDASHPELPLIDYVNGTVGQKSSVQAVLRSLSSPEVENGDVKCSADELPKECARWLRMSGVCLFGLDEMQFMSQSSSASTLITRTLLALMDLQVPWFVIGNYSLVWKLLDRPSEAQQRLLGRAIVIFPDAPGSSDWRALLCEYQVVLGEALDFSLLNYSLELWNLCAGLKRELVKLLVISYKIARSSGASVMSWEHVRQAFASVPYAASRTDVNLLIAHAGQNGLARKDLRCPFDGPEVRERLSSYGDQLRLARVANIARVSVEASMNARELAAIKLIKRAEQKPTVPTGQVIRLTRKRKLRTLDSMTHAGEELLATLPPGKKT